METSSKEVGFIFLRVEILPGSFIYFSPFLTTLINHQSALTLSKLFGSDDADQAVLPCLCWHSLVIFTPDLEPLFTVTTAGGPTYFTLQVGVRVTLKVCFMAVVSVYNPRMFVWIDETGCNRRNTLPKYGYSLRGIPISDLCPLVWGKRYSAIPVAECQSIPISVGFSWFGVLLFPDASQRVNTPLLHKPHFDRTMLFAHA